MIHRFIRKIIAAARPTRRPVQTSEPVDQNKSLPVENRAALAESIATQALAAMPDHTTPQPMAVLPDHNPLRSETQRTGDSPYANLSPSAFWKTGVAGQHPATISDLYKKRFALTPDMQIATAGSCFAQHIARHLRERQYSVMDLELAPRDLPDEVAKQFGYRLYSARFANIYVCRHLLQLAKEAFGKTQLSDIVWEKNGRFYDALRPSVEPFGLDSADEVLFHRKQHLTRVRKMLSKMDVFVFTFGLTEAWVNQNTSTVYPTAPGTIAGSYDPHTYVFKNFDYTEILADFTEFRSLVKSCNPKVKFILTVSPVPLTATASGAHVLAATTYSKSVLRAVAGKLYEQFDDIDYFPSYEIISTPFSRGLYFDSNMRNVVDAGVENVMRIFFSEHEMNQSLGAEPIADQAEDIENSQGNAQKDIANPQNSGEQDNSTVCEDILLDAFSK